jgi:hypothetical protein
VFRNDEITVEGIARAEARPAGAVARALLAGRSRHLCGGHPALAGKLPILGVCLGHQSIGAALGGRIVRAQQQMHGKTSTITTDQQRRVCRACRSSSASSATTRWPSSAPAARRAGGHGTGPTTARSWACATRPGRHRHAAGRRAVPPRVHPHRAWPRHAEELSEMAGRMSPLHERPHGIVDLRSDTVTRPPRPCAPRWPRAGGRRRLRRRPQRQRAAGRASRRCWASRRRCSCPPARRATCARSWRIASAATNTSWARWPTPTAGKAAARRCWAASSRSRWPMQADGTLALADIEAAIKPDDAHFARTRLLALENTWAARCCRWTMCSRPPRWRAAGAWPRHLDGARLFNAAVARPADRRRALAEARASPLRQRLGVLQQGPGRAGGLGAVRQRAT